MGKGLSGVNNHFMSYVVWELKQHLYSACFVLGLKLPSGKL